MGSKTSALRQALCGISGVHATAYAGDGAIDSAVTARIIERIVAGGIHNLVAAGNTSEFYTLAPDEVRLLHDMAIARALMLEPEVLLLDEPTSALDVSVQAEILNLLTDLRAARGLTYVLVSHDLAVIAQMCHRIAVMQGGAIIDSFDVEQLRVGAVSHPYTRTLLAASEAYGEAPPPQAA